ncbi:MAG: site-2 protease family protein [Acidobacteriota bacterium]
MDIINIIISFAVVLFSLSVHESFHAWTAYKFGDPTGKMMGRITLNPIAHISIIGTIIFPLLLAFLKAPIFGWAKPVMVNTRYLRDPIRDNMWISAAGPLSNLGVAFISFLVLIILKQIDPSIAFFLTSYFTKSVSLSSGIYLAKGLAILAFTMLFINLTLAIFNLIPIPPLDGSNVLLGLLPRNLYLQYQKIFPYGFLILFLFLYLGVIDLIFRIVLSPVIRIVLKVLLI